MEQPLFHSENEKIKNLETYAQEKIYKEYPNTKIDMSFHGGKFGISFQREGVQHYRGYFSFDSFEKIEAYILDDEYKNILDTGESHMKDTYGLNDQDLNKN